LGFAKAHAASLNDRGSPPGIRAIRDQLLPLSFPAHVRTWYNAHDPRDVVALYPLNNDNCQSVLPWTTIRA
jgi:hypothetical protein